VAQHQLLPPLVGFTKKLFEIFFSVAHGWGSRKRLWGEAPKRLTLQTHGAADESATKGAQKSKDVARHMKNMKYLKGTLQIINPQRILT
jgi:hypothetical protein